VTLRDQTAKRVPNVGRAPDLPCAKMGKFKDAGI